MQPIQINVQVNIGLNSELFSLLSSVVNRPVQMAELSAAPSNEKLAQLQTELKPEVTNQPTPTDGYTKAEVVQELKDPEEEVKPEPALDPAPESNAAAKEYTEVDVRAAMDRTRKRIEGEDYKEKTDSEGYKKWHRTLTAWFKNTAAVFGAEKPSALSDSESRRKFIACCDAVRIKDDELVENCPF